MIGDVSVARFVYYCTTQYTPRDVVLRYFAYRRKTGHVMSLGVGSPALVWYGAWISTNQSWAFTNDATDKVKPNIVDSLLTNIFGKTDFILNTPSNITD